jgi:hypothetical protein
LGEQVMSRSEMYACLVIPGAMDVSNTILGHRRVDSSWL